MGNRRKADGAPGAKETSRIREIVLARETGARKEEPLQSVSQVKEPHPAVLTLVRASRITSMGAGPSHHRS